jgi:hypothetical protein
VLLEHPDEAAGLAIASGLRFAGYAVGVCPGPAGHGRCPLTGPAGCAPAHDADLVVSSLGYEHEAAREVLRELRTRYPETPLVASEVSEEEPLKAVEDTFATFAPDEVIVSTRWERDVPVRVQQAAHRPRPWHRWSRSGVTRRRT